MKKFLALLSVLVADGARANDPVHPADAATIDICVGGTGLAVEDIAS